MLSVFCAFPVLATTGSVPTPPPEKGKLMTGTFSQRFQLTNDKAHKQVIFKNLDTGASETFSLVNNQKTSNAPMPASGTIHVVGMSSPVPSGWTELNSYTSYNNSTYATFTGTVTLLRSTNAVDASGDYDFALEMASNIVGKGNLLWDSGIHDFQWYATNTPTSDSVLHVIPDGTTVTTGNQKTYTMDVSSSLGGFSETWSPDQTKLTGMYTPSSYQETWTDSPPGVIGYPCVPYPDVVPLQGVSVYHGAAGVPINWNWNWTWHYLVL
jgi:hypothetical protein